MKKLLVLMIVALLTMFSLPFALAEEGVPVVTV